MCIRSKFGLSLRKIQSLTIARMAQETIQTALIMEEDADWDVMLKVQMLEIALGAPYVQDSMNLKRSLYGDE